MNRNLHTLMEDVQRDKKHRIEYYVDGPYTCCVIRVKRGLKTTIGACGFSKCNPNYDECNRKRGEEIAFARAVRNLYDL